MKKLSGFPSSPCKKIGTITLTEIETFTNRNYETASWWSEVTCEPQTVDLYSNGYYVSFGFEGIRSDEYFVIRIGAHSSVAAKRDIGKSDVYISNMYDYSFCDGVRDGTLPYPVEFADGFDIMENFVGEKSGKTFYCIGKAS